MQKISLYANLYENFNSFRIYSRLITNRLLNKIEKITPNFFFVFGTQDVGMKGTEGLKVQTLYYFHETSSPFSRMGNLLFFVVLH